MAGEVVRLEARGEDRGGAAENARLQARIDELQQQLQSLRKIGRAHV